MKEVKEPEIKLFGRKIMLPDNAGDVSGESISGNDCFESSGRGGGEAEAEYQQEDQEEECETRMQENDDNPDAAEEPPNPSAESEIEKTTKTPIADEDLVPENDASMKGTELKKPDKIIPCPRCSSMDTKFCYYNNYNVNQPRHFCKSCQRYWTAGGTMRNVPVGAGRRKNKNSAPEIRHISMSEVLQAARVDMPNGFIHPQFRPNERTNGLSFGRDSPLCESMASAMSLSDKRSPNGYCQKGESRDDCSSFTTTSSSVVEGGQNGLHPQQAMMPNLNGVPYPIPCIPGVAWPIPWNPAMPFPAMCPPGYPVPVYPGPFWNCGAPNAWNVSWVSAPSLATNQKAKSSCSAPSSPLGKHSRNGELLKPGSLEGEESKNVKRSILVPKTLRIDDPEEAAKSSIWETLGIKYDSMSREGLFKALQPKEDAKKLMVPAASPALQANPAALSRSINFQEGV